VVSSLGGATYESAADSNYDSNRRRRRAERAQARKAMGGQRVEFT